MGFAGGQRFDAQSMHVSFQKISERRIHHAVALQLRLGGERHRDDMHVIMSLTGMGMSGMQRAVIADIQLQRPEGGLQLPADTAAEVRIHGSTLRNGLTVTRAYTPAAP